MAGRKRDGFIPFTIPGEEKMKVTLFHNPKSGIFNGQTPDKLTGALAEAGYEATYRTSESPEELDQILNEVDGPLVIAGGDGSVREVATRVMGRNNPLMILPMGTANNISRALNGDSDVLTIIQGLKNPTKRFFDMGRLSSPWGLDYFLESLGIGFYASILNYYEPEKGKSILRGIESILEGLSEYQAPKSFQITLDGQDISGEYLLVEILNTPTIGPRLKLAARTDPQDGLFNVVRVRDDGQNGLLHYVTSLVKGQIEELPNVLVNQGRSLEILWDGFPLHLDDQVLPVKEQGAGEEGDPGVPEPGSSMLKVDILPRVLEFWLPNLDDKNNEQPRQAEL
jgi:diacylglycerol kinase (ATP)